MYIQLLEKLPESGHLFWWCDKIKYGKVYVKDNSLMAQKEWWDDNPIEIAYHAFDKWHDPEGFSWLDWRIVSDPTCV